MKSEQTNLPRVLVLMAVYNGAQYLQEQIESILTQKNVDVTLLIVDDCSQDNSLAICNAYACEFENVIVRENANNVGCTPNFMNALYSSDCDGYEYFAFADQDDVWLPEKLDVATRALGSRKTPALYFSDFYNVNENLSNPVPELINFKGLESAPASAIVRAWVNGCVMVFNSAFRDIIRAYRPPSFPRGHDAWIHAIARYTADVIADYDNALQLRRIHGKNAVGAATVKYNTPFKIADAIRTVLSDSTHSHLIAAQFMLEGYRPFIKEEYLPLLEEFIHYRSSLSSRISFARNPLLRTPDKQQQAIIVGRTLLGTW